MSEKDGEWSGTSGSGDLQTGEKPDQHGQFRAASVMKSVTATMVLQLVDEGKLGLDEIIQQRMPGLLPYPEPITVRQLLQHTSGLPRAAIFSDVTDPAEYLRQSDSWSTRQPRW